MARFDLAFTVEALEDLKFLRKSEQKAILEGIERQLSSEPLKETRNRKPLRPNDLSSWEVRLGKFRVFYDVSSTRRSVIIKAIGWKEHNVLFIRGKEFSL